MGFFPKLLWISLASFFVIHSVIGLGVWALTPSAIRAAGRMRAASATRFLLAIRLFPSAFALFAVAVLCVPSYLWLEPEAAGEEISLPCFVAAMLSAAMWIISIARSVGASSRSLRYLRNCRNHGRELKLAGYPVIGWVMDDGGCSVGLAGIFRPQVIVGREILDTFSREQLDAAMRHEWAHASSRDNLKKLLLLLAPDVLLLLRSRFADLDREWAKFAEWAADDRAVAGDLRRSLSLADALVAVARMGVPLRTPPLITSLVAQPGELCRRVDRLVEFRPDTPTLPLRRPLLGASLAIAVLFLAVSPSILSAVHEMLEGWVR